MRDIRPLENQYSYIRKPLLDIIYRTHIHIYVHQSLFNSKSFMFPAIYTAPSEDLKYSTHKNHRHITCPPRGHLLGFCGAGYATALLLARPRTSSDPDSWNVPWNALGNAGACCPCLVVKNGTQENRRELRRTSLRQVGAWAYTILLGGGGGVRLLGEVEGMWGKGTPAPVQSQGDRWHRNQLLKQSREAKNKLKIFTPRKKLIFPCDYHNHNKRG